MKMPTLAETLAAKTAAPKKEATKLSSRAERAELEAQRDADMAAIPDLTENTESEVGEQLQAIKDFETKWANTWAFDGDVDYFFSVVFESREQRDDFLARSGMKLEAGNYMFYEDLKKILKE